MNITLPSHTLEALTRLAERLWLPSPSDYTSLAALARMARFVPDLPEFFPDGQHRTLQDIESKLDIYARAYAEHHFAHRENFDRERAR